MVGWLQKKFLVARGLKKYTPIFAVALGIGYFFTPLAGLDPDAAVMTKIFYGVVFGFSVIGGRSFVKNVSGSKDKPSEPSAPATP